MKYSVLRPNGFVSTDQIAFTKEYLTRMTSLQRVRYFRLLLLIFVLAAPLLAQQPHRGGGEANLILPDLDQAVFFGGIGGRTLLMTGLVISRAWSWPLAWECTRICANCRCMRPCSRSRS